MKGTNFRGKKLNSRTGIYEYDYAFGDLVKELETGKTFICDLRRFDDKTLLKDVIIEVYPETVGQYTELKDCTRKEVYRGDIFNINGKIMFVEYHEDHGRYVLTTGNGYDTSNCVDLDCDIIYEKAIIGNIHEKLI